MLCVLEMNIISHMTLSRIQYLPKICKTTYYLENVGNLLFSFIHFVFQKKFTAEVKIVGNNINILFLNNVLSLSERNELGL